MQQSLQPTARDVKHVSHTLISQESSHWLAQMTHASAYVQIMSTLQVLRSCHLWVHGRGIQAKPQVTFLQHSGNATRPPGVLLSPEALHQARNSGVSDTSMGSDALHVV